MSVSIGDIDRAVTAARVREQQGYFARAHGGDGRAASLFVRLIAFDLNPSGNPGDWGWLSKQPGETNYDGYADGAIVFGNDQTNVQNVLKLVVHVGEAPSTIGNAIQERRVNNTWVKPHALTADELSYLLSGGQPTPQPQPVPQVPSYEALGGDSFFRAMIGVPLQADMLSVGQPLNDGSSVWFSRTIYDLIAAFLKANGAPVDVNGIVKTHRNEWRAILGLPPL